MSSPRIWYKDNAGNLYSDEQVHIDEPTGKAYASHDCVTELQPIQSYTGTTPDTIDPVEYGEPVTPSGPETISPTQLPGDK